MTNKEYWQLRNNPDIVEHSGTKGMQWGRRLYQNKDGSLTPLGRAHYGYGNNDATYRKDAAGNVTNSRAKGTKVYLKSERLSTRAHLAENKGLVNPDAQKNYVTGRQQSGKDAKKRERARAAAEEAEKEAAKNVDKRGSIAKAANSVKDKGMVNKDADKDFERGRADNDSDKTQRSAAKAATENRSQTNQNGSSNNSGSSKSESSSNKQSSEEAFKKRMDSDKLAADTLNNASKVAEGAKKLVSINNQPQSKPRMNLSNMSDEELSSAIKRERLEKSYNELFNAPEVDRGKQRTEKFLDTAATALGVAGSAMTLYITYQQFKKSRE